MNPEEENIQPHTGLERGLLGGILAGLLAPGIATAEDQLTPGDLADPRHRVIYRAIADLAARGTVNTDLVIDELTKTGKLEASGGIKYLGELLAGDEPIATEKEAREYISRLKTGRGRRDALELLARSRERLIKNPGDFRAVLEELETEARKQTRAADMAGGRLLSMTEMAPGLVKELLSRQRKPIPTFSQKLNDNLNGGLQLGKMFIISGRSGGGKTTFALQLLEEVAGLNRYKAEGGPANYCLYIHLEQSPAELLVKSLARQGQINGGAIEGQHKTQEELAEALVKYEAIGRYFFIVAAPAGLLLRDLRGYIRRLDDQITEPHRLIICVDPLQSLNSGDPTKDREDLTRLGEVAYGLKTISRDLNVALVVLSDTTIKGASQQDPEKAELVTAARGSYQIEHRADISAYLQTPPRYSGKSDPEGFNGRHPAIIHRLEEDKYNQWNTEAAVWAELMFTKQRTGAGETIPFLFKMAYSEFIPEEKIGGRMVRG
jgi:replicative DNA helicase